MAKVVKLRPGEQTPVQETIAAAELLLRRCKTGEVRGFAVATIMGSEPYTGSTSAVSPDDPLGHKLLIAAIEEMRHEFKHALRGG